MSAMRTRLESSFKKANKPHISVTRNLKKMDKGTESIIYRLDHHVVLKCKSEKYCEVFNIKDIDENGDARGFRFSLPFLEDMMDCLFSEIARNAISIRISTLSRDAKNENEDFQYTIFLRTEAGIYQRIFDRWYAAPHKPPRRDWLGDCLSYMQQTNYFFVLSRAAMLPDGSCIFICDREKREICEEDISMQDGMVLQTLVGDGIRLLSKNLLAVKNGNQLDVFWVDQKGLKDRAEPILKVKELVPPEPAAYVESVQCQLVGSLLFILSTTPEQVKTVEQVWDINTNKMIKYHATEKTYSESRLIPNTHLCINALLQSERTTAIQLKDMHSQEVYLQSDELKQQGSSQPIVVITADGMIQLFNNSKHKSEYYRLEDMIPPSKIAAYLHHDCSARFALSLGLIVASYYYDPKLVKVDGIDLLRKFEEEEKAVTAPAVLVARHERRPQSPITYSTSRHVLLPPGSADSGDSCTPPDASNSISAASCERKT